MIVRCILRSLGRIMGCLFGCFRFKDDHHRRSKSFLISSNNRQHDSFSRNRLGSLFVSEGYEQGSPSKGMKDYSSESPQQNSNERELKEEAKFLKSCGTLLETPVEIRKASERVKNRKGDAEISKFHSWLPSTSIEQLQWEEQPNQVPISTVKHEDLGEELGSLGQDPSSCVSKGQKVLGNMSSSYHRGSGAENTDSAKKVPNHTIDNGALLSIASEPPATTQCKNKSVNFEFESDKAILHLNGQGTTDFDSPGSDDTSKFSPYPTPLKLTDEMETPGTVYPMNIDNLANGKTARIRSQYVYHVLNPVQNFSQLMERKEEDHCTHKQLDTLRESLEQSETGSPDNSAVLHTNNLAMNEEATVGKVEASLSHWLKPASSRTDKEAQNYKSVSSGGSPTKTPPTERPILGTVAAHWNQDELSRIPAKWWDGNGIPNSTNKYKEDQKVSWHATPFEERLEKALSNETLVCQRRFSSEPVEFVESEESDTAVSSLQTSKHAESLVSC